jgi:hypothetical protein
MEPMTVKMAPEQTWSWRGLKPTSTRVYHDTDHSTGISWAGFWIALAAMNMTSQLIAAGII